MSIEVIDREGGHHELEWDPADSLMETLRDNGLPVLASCGGQRSCATCHVYLEPNTIEIVGVSEGEEQELLEDSEAYQPEFSRLSCQVSHSPQLEGIRVTLAPEE